MWTCLNITSSIFWKSLTDSSLVLSVTFTIFDPSSDLYRSFNEGLLRIAFTWEFLEGLNDRWTTAVLWADDWIYVINFIDDAESWGELLFAEQCLPRDVTEVVVIIAAVFFYLLIVLISFWVVSKWVGSANFSSKSTTDSSQIALSNPRVFSRSSCLYWWSLSTSIP